MRTGVCDVITATDACSATVTTPEAITPTLVDVGARLGNYAVTTVKGTLTVTSISGGNNGGEGDSGGGSGGCGLGGGFAALVFLSLLTLQFLAARRRG